MRAYSDLGADILFLETPWDKAEMARFCREVPGVKMVNMLEETPMINSSPSTSLPMRPCYGTRAPDS